MENEQKPLEVGEVVCLKSGGCRMCVRTAPNQLGMVEVSWHDERGQAHNERYWQTMLSRSLG